MTKRMTLLLLLGLAVSGCASGGPAVTAVGIASSAGTLLSEAAQTGCAVEKVSNDLGAVLPKGAGAASAISRFAGQLCAW
jgi:hypothetical protein